MVVSALLYHRQKLKYSGKRLMTVQGGIKLPFSRETSGRARLRERQPSAAFSWGTEGKKGNDEHGETTDDKQ